MLDSITCPFIAVLDKVSENFLYSSSYLGRKLHSLSCPKTGLCEAQLGACLRQTCDILCALQNRTAVFINDRKSYPQACFCPSFPRPLESLAHKEVPRCSFPTTTS